MTLDSGDIRSMRIDIRGGTQDLCKFSLDLHMPASIYTGMVCRSRCQYLVVR